MGGGLKFAECCSAWTTSRLNLHFKAAPPLDRPWLSVLTQEAQLAGQSAGMRYMLYSTSYMTSILVRVHKLHA